MGVEILLPKRFSPVAKSDEQFLEIRVPKKGSPISLLPLEPIEKTDSNLNSDSELEHNNPLKDLTGFNLPLNKVSEKDDTNEQHSSHHNAEDEL